MGCCSLKKTEIGTLTMGAQTVSNENDDPTPTESQSEEEPEEVPAIVQNKPLNIRDRPYLSLFIPKKFRDMIVDSEKVKEACAKALKITHKLIIETAKFPSATTVNLLLPYIKGRSGLYKHCGGKDSTLVAKGLSFVSLDNRIIDSINYSIKQVKDIYKNQELPKDGELFKDTLFPPTWESFQGKRNGEFVEKNPSRLKKLKAQFEFKEKDIIWLRAGEIFPSNYSLFTNDISLNDVMQGNLGNCYLFSSIAALTSRPQLICQVFKSFKVPQNGCYQMGMKIEGKWKIVLLDDYFPCFKKTKQPLFARPRGELWVMLLEKAWAKINGGYMNITGGSASEVLSTLTSFPIETIRFKNITPEALWERMQKVTSPGKSLFGAFVSKQPKETSKLNEIITACTQNKEHELLRKNGLIPGHAFTVVDVKEGIIQNKNIQLIRLRNPWAYGEWTGPWSDNSIEWTPEAKEVFENKVLNEGIFWMSFQDFCNYFCSIDICKVSSPQCVKSLVIPKENVECPNVFELQIFTRTRIELAVYKKKFRFHRTMATESELVINVIVVKKEESGDLKFIHSVHHNEDNPKAEFEVTVGYYLVYVHANYLRTSFDKKRKYRLYISANKYFDLFEKGCDVNFSLLHTIMEERALEFAGQEPYWTANIFEKTTYGYLLIQNNTDKPRHFLGKDQSLNYYLLSPFNPQCLSFTLPPFQNAILIGIRLNYYDDFKFSVILEEQENEYYPPYPDPKSGLSLFLTNEPDHPLDENGYDFIYKQAADFNEKHYIEEINFIGEAAQYFLDKYPNEMILILKSVPFLDDGEEVIFRDKFFYQDYFYLGEWKIKENLCKHGRGIMIWDNGKTYIGQFQNDKMEGFGVLYNKNNENERIEITWKQGKMDGKGKKICSDGSVVIVEYQDGEELAVSKMEEEGKIKENEIV